MAEKKALKEKFRRDYTPTNYFVEQVNLLFQIFEDCTKVSSSLKVKRRDGAPENAPFQLDGEGLTLQSLSIDGETLPPSRYSWVEEDLVEISGPLPSSFVLQSLVTTKPEENTQLSGLYKSSSIYCTQCEAEGFRRITLMQDRPDIMATYEVRIEADKESCPVLLSNGNMTENGDLENGRHFATYNDPFPKPSCKLKYRRLSSWRLTSSLLSFLLSYRPVCDGGGRPRLHPGHVCNKIREGGGLEHVLRAQQRQEALSSHGLFEEGQEMG